MDAARPDLYALLVAGLNAVDPSAAVQRVVRQDDGAVVVGDQRLETTDHLQVLAFGKASLAMVDGLAEALPNLTLSGFVVTPNGRTDVRAVVSVRGDHPVPGLRSLIGGRRLLAAAAVTPPDMPTIVLVSGGGSALAEVLAPEISLEWIAAVTSPTCCCSAEQRSMS
jgi:glycerate-2-kinase